MIHFVCILCSPPPPPSLLTLMNAKQLRAKRRRERQKRNKKLKFRDVGKISSDNKNYNPNVQSPSPLSLLNKRVTFDHLTFDTTGFILIPLTGTIIKLSNLSNISSPNCSDPLLTILIDSHHNHQQQRHNNKRTESLLGAEDGVIEATASSLLNFKLI